MKTQGVMLLFVFLLFVPGLLCAGNTGFELKYESLTGALGVLKDTDRGAVSQAIEYIKQGQNSLALARLAELNQNNPGNSSLRILASYALLQVGNMIGAFEEAQKAESAANGNAYKCWFLAKVALLAGKSAVCEREVGHLKKAGAMTAEVRQLETEMKARRN